MTFLQARNTVINGLAKHIAPHHVIPSGQTSKRLNYPLCYYSVLASNIQNHIFGLRNVEQHGRRYILQRSEQVEATLSFTCCSQNRDMGHDNYVFGEDEAFTLAEKCRGFFLLNGHNIPTKQGEIVIYEVGAVENRRGFYKTDLSSASRQGEYEEPVCRFGFDVRFAYVRTDEMPIATIRKANAVGKLISKGGKSHG